MYFAMALCHRVSLDTPQGWAFCFYTVLLDPPKTWITDRETRWVVRSSVDFFLSLRPGLRNRLGLAGRLPDC